MDYYNEIDPFAVRWLRSLIAAGLIPGGDVDERSILAHGVPGRVGRLRGFGNAIVPQVAAEFVRAAREARLAFTMSNS
jgi:hypothetical protein